MFLRGIKKKYQVRHDGGVRQNKKYDEVAVFSRFVRFSPYDLYRYLTIIIIIDFFRFFFFQQVFGGRRTPVVSRPGEHCRGRVRTAKRRGPGAELRLVGGG